MRSYTEETYFTNDNHLSRCLLLLMNFDVMTSNDMAYLFGRSQSTTQKYLSSIKSLKLITNLRVGRVSYWHILPAGVHELERLLGRKFKTDATTIRSVQKIRSALPHDAVCTDMVMNCIRREEVYQWLGPTMTRRIYASHPSGRTSHRDDYNPDAILGVLGPNGLGGTLHIELDNSNQSARKCMEKVKKARSQFNRNGIINPIIAFITSRSEDRVWNLVSAAEKFYLDEADESMRILVIGTTVERILSGGLTGSEWFSNTGSILQHSLDEFLYEPIGEGIYPIGSDLWKDAYNTDPTTTLPLIRKAFK